ncbi:hypothetical protein JCM18899A_38700 [Nocardioides sp. AN3]
MLDPTARERLAALSDVLIPGAGDFPSASDAGVPTELIDRALGFRPDLVPDVEQALALTDGLDAAAALDLLSTGYAEVFASLTTAISGAYLQSPQVQGALHYRPAPRQAHDDVDSYADLLEVVADRGFDIHGADLA